MSLLDCAGRIIVRLQSSFGRGIGSDNNMASAVIIVIDGFQVQVCDCGTVDVTHQAVCDTLSTGSFSSLFARTA